jgi:hypothetical protein
LPLPVCGSVLQQGILVNLTFSYLDGIAPTRADAFTAYANDLFGDLVDLYDGQRARTDGLATTLPVALIRHLLRLT